MNYDIIIIGVTHHNTLGMVRCVGQMGRKVDLLILTEQPCRSFVSASRYVNKTIFLQSDDEILDVLINFKSSDGAKSIVISCTDSSAHTLDMSYDFLKEKFEFFNAGANGRISHFMDKQIQVEIAKKVGLTVPQSIKYEGEIGRVKYPCIIKPLKSISGGKKIIVCDEEVALKAGLVSFEGTELIIQEFIKKDSEIVVLGISTHKGIYIPGYIKKHRECDGGTTYSTVYDSSSLPDTVVNGCRSIVEESNYIGLFGIEFVIYNDNYYFIEINLRNDATTYALAVAGVNLLDYYLRVLYDEKFTVDCPKFSCINAIVEYNDFKHRHDYGISYLTWIKQYLKSKCKYYYSVSDLFPFLIAPFK